LFSHEAAGAGLLHKSLLFLKLDREADTGSESILIVGETPHITRLLEKIEQLTNDFSYFPGLYALLVKELSLPKSAFFLYNGMRSSFTPWLSRGLDPSLARVLEYTETQWRGTLSSSFRLENGRQLFPELRRELPQPLYHFPFIYKGTLEGSLLVCNLALHPQSRDAIESFFKQLSSKVGAAIDRILKSYKNFSRPSRLFTTPETALPALLESGAGRPDTFLILTISLTPVIKILSGNFGFFDSTRVQEILLYAINSTFSHLGVATPHGEEQIVLVVRASQCYSPELLVATLTQSITDIFKGLFPAPPVLTASRVFEYPACGMKPLEIAAAL
jgi:hypothetical protein